MMMLKYDFKLSHRFSVLEKLIYRLVINGITSVETITDLLPVFSDKVIALSIQKLVNAQLLNVDIGTRSISLSNMSLLLIDACAEKQFDLDVPDEYDIEFSAGNAITIDDPKVTEVILQNLLPNVKTAFLSSLLNFVVLRGESNE